MSWGWLFDVGGGGNRTGRIGGLLQCAGATGAVRSTFVGLGGLGWFVDAAQVADGLRGEVGSWEVIHFRNLRPAPESILRVPHFRKIRLP